MAATGKIVPGRYLLADASALIDGGDVTSLPFTPRMDSVSIYRPFYMFRAYYPFVEVSQPYEPGSVYDHVWAFYSHTSVICIVNILDIHIDKLPYVVMRSFDVAGDTFHIVRDGSLLFGDLLIESSRN